LVLLPLASVIAKLSRSRAVLFVDRERHFGLAYPVAIFAIFYADWDAVIITSLQVLIPDAALKGRLHVFICRARACLPARPTGPAGKAYFPATVGAAGPVNWSR